MNKAVSTLFKKAKLTFVCSIVDNQVSESDYRVSVAGNRFQLKLLSLIQPETTINISPYFLDRRKSAHGLSSNEVFLDTRILGPRPLKIIGKVIGDSLHFVFLIGLKDPMIVVLYNLDYANVILALLARLFGHKTFVVAADYVSTATNFYETFLLWSYRQMSGVITLRKNHNLNKKFLVLPAIVDIYPEEIKGSACNANILFSGSLGETTGLNLVINAAIARPHLRFFFTGRPFHLSEQRLSEMVDAANANGADIIYLKMLPFAEYCKILAETCIALSLRDTSCRHHDNNFPSKIAEYMFAGKVVLSSIAYPELADNTYVHVSYSSDKLIKALDNLIHDVDLMREISLRAKHFAASSFTPPAIKSSLIKFLNNG
jgi:glycosyltransferase involved in cell wall biosynthesis